MDSNLAKIFIYLMPLLILSMVSGLHPNWEIEKSRLLFHFTASEARDNPYSREPKTIFPIPIPKNKQTKGLFMEPSSTVLNFAPMPSGSRGLTGSNVEKLSNTYLPPKNDNPIKPTLFTASLELPKEIPRSESNSVKKPPYSPQINPSRLINNGGAQSSPSNTRVIPPSINAYQHPKLSIPVESQSDVQNQVASPRPHFHYRYHYHKAGTQGETPTRPTAPSTSPPPPRTLPPISTTTSTPFPPTAIDASKSDNKEFEESYDKTGAQNTSHQASASDREIRFLIYKPGDEEIIKNAIVQDATGSNEQVSFLEGPSIVLEKQQKVRLPKRKKTVLYIMLKEPQINTNVEVVEPDESDAKDDMEVYVIYEGADKKIKQRHYKLDAAGRDSKRVSGTSHLHEESLHAPVRHSNHLRNLGLNNPSSQFAFLPHHQLFKTSESQVSKKYLKLPVPLLMSMCPAPKPNDENRESRSSEKYSPTNTKLNNDPYDFNWINTYKKKHRIL